MGCAGADGGQLVTQPRERGEVAAGDEDRVVAGDGADDAGEEAQIDGRGDRVRRSRCRAQDEQRRRLVDGQGQVGQQAAQALGRVGIGTLDQVVGEQVARRPAAHPPHGAKRGEVARHGGLGHRHAQLTELGDELLLRADPPAGDQLAHQLAAVDAAVHALAPVPTAAWTRVPVASPMSAASIACGERPSRIHTSHPATAAAMDEDAARVRTRGEERETGGLRAGYAANLHGERGELCGRVHVRYSLLIATYSADRSQPHATPLPPPSPRSRRRATFRRRSAALARRSSNGHGSPAKTWMSPIQIFSRSASRATPLRPAAAAIRPQFGSPPWTAAFTRLDVTTVRATRRASRVSPAPSTRTSTRRGPPPPTPAD